MQFNNCLSNKHPAALLASTPQQVRSKLSSTKKKVSSYYYFLLLFLCLFLTSCAHVKKDGPPHFYVDERKIPNATPKAEPLSKYGNKQTYYVFGKCYHVMKSHHYYEEKGIASWYGTKFHARRTSSGERYNMLAMTAAHRSLPLPTYVEVTNLANHRKIIVKVNDRGPLLPIVLLIYLTWQQKNFAC